MTYPRKLVLQIRVNSQWRVVGEVSLLGHEQEGLNAKSEFCYDLDYAIEFADRSDHVAVSCALPVSTVPYSFESWPPFLLDLFPQGAALRYVVDHYRIADRPENYWQIIKTARMNPPGNLRAVADFAPALGHSPNRSGFDRTDVLAKGHDFLEYMIEQGAPVAGSTGASGAAPKFLLREDLHGKFHADGGLDDKETKNFWLVKFPRGPSSMDQAILFAEHAYLEIARDVGLYVEGIPTWEDNCLFVPRFDRCLNANRVQYFGLESFYSLVGMPEFGSRLLHETYIHALLKVSTKPEEDIIEYVLRDFLNFMMGNTDNHGRNSSVLKTEHSVRLAPLYDFAPMRFDPEGIVRCTRWGNDTKEGDITSIATFLEHQCGIAKSVFDQRLSAFHHACANLEERMQKKKIPQRFIEGTAHDRIFMQREMNRYLKEA